MLKRKSYFLILLFILTFLINISFITPDSEINHIGNEEFKSPENSANLEGVENIIITNIFRIANISAYGLISFEDYITFKNYNNNPINSIIITIPLNHSSNLIFFEAIGSDGNTLLAEYSNMILDTYEVFSIYFDSPLLPQQSKQIKLIHQYNNLLFYSLKQNQYISYTGSVFPTLPYKAEKAMQAYFYVSLRSNDIDGEWGFADPNLYRIKYDFEYIREEVKDPYIAPFLANLAENKEVTVSFYHTDITRTEIKRVDREIFLSPWGIIRVKENYEIENLGIIDFYRFSLKLPLSAKNVYIADELGEILGSELSKDSKFKILSFNLIENRLVLKPNSSFNFKIEYNLPFEKYFSINWFQESFYINLFTTSSDYLEREQNVKIIIDGCLHIDDITDPPNSIKNSYKATIITYNYDYISPLERKEIQVTFTIDYFDFLFRPLIFVFLFSIIGSIFVLLIKTGKKEIDSSILQRELIPVNEIREFCSLFEEKNALTLEMRQAEEDAKRKKIAKKNYKNLVNKNNSKIDIIQKEIIPFKKSIMETSETFGNIIKKMDLLEAERISVKDSISLLENRYKRGRLPSRAAYLKLLDDFQKRMKKIDRTIDKLIQQLRSYLL